MSWIPVNEKLPKERVHVLATIIRGKYRYVVEAYYTYREWYYTSGMPIGNGEVVGWQHLPKPMESA